MKTILFYLAGTIMLLTASMYHSQAQQQPETILFRDTAGLYIRWQGHSGQAFEGYNLYRSIDDQPFEQINPELLSITRDFDRIMERAGRFYGGMYMGLFTDTDEERDISEEEILNVLVDPDTHSFLSLMSITQYPIAQLVGEVFLDTAIPEDAGQVQYRVTLVSREEEDIYAQTEPIDPFVADEVPAVDTLWAEGRDRQAVIFWNRSPHHLASGEITAYNIYRSQRRIGPWERINPAHIAPISIRGADRGEEKQNRQSHQDRFLENQQEYFYHIRAVNSFGIESRPSPIIRVVAGDTHPPRPPYNLYGEVFGGSIKLSWEYTRQDQVKGFEVYKGSRKSENFEKLFPFSELELTPEMRQYIDLDVEPGEQVYYFLRSVGVNDSLSAPSDTLSFYYSDRVPPLPPANVEADADSARVVISWSPNPEENLLGYEVERASDSGLNSRFLMTEAAISDTVFIDSIAINTPATLGYVVYALDESMNRSRPSEMVTARLTDITPPSTPVLHQLIHTNGEIFLRWSQNPEADMHSYRIYRAVNDSLNLRFHTGRLANTLIEEPDQPGTYYYAVAAVDSSGNVSPRSAVSYIHIKEGPPAPPMEGSAQWDENGHVTLAWEHSPSANLAGYMVQRSNHPEDAHKVDLAQLDAHVQNYIDKFSPDDDELYYLIYAFDNKWLVSEPLILQVE